MNMKYLPSRSLRNWSEMPLVLQKCRAKRSENMYNTRGIKVYELNLEASTPFPVMAGADVVSLKDGQILSPKLI